MITQFHTMAVEVNGKSCVIKRWNSGCVEQTNY